MYSDGAHQPYALCWGGVEERTKFVASAEPGPVSVPACLPGAVRYELVLPAEVAPERRELYLTGVAAMPII